MADDYRALIQRDASDWAMQTVRLHIVERRGRDRACLRADGAWQTATEGEALPTEAGLLLPAASIAAIAEAIAAFQGDAGHAATEVRVLREWLAAERARVDAVLDPRP